MADQRTPQGSRWRSLRRDISRATFFLTTNFVRLIAPALALPTITPTSTTSSTAAAPSTTSPAGGDRDGSFQILADGTQDIAALVGIFATDSVERYAIDYSRGYLATVVSTLSLLGLLGYVRLLFKLSLGAERCQKAGLDLKALRPMFGIQDEDYVPADKIHEVCYVERMRQDGCVKWRVMKRIRHTGESLQLVADDKRFRRNEPDHRDIGSKWLTVRYIDSIEHSRFRGHPLLSQFLSIAIGARHSLVLLFLSTICVGATCFSIAPFAGAFRHQPWTYYYATIGLFCSIIIPNTMWNWVHMQEHHPHGMSDWTTFCGWIRKGGKFPDEDSLKSRSLDMKDAFALSRNGPGFTTYDVKLVGERLRKGLQVLSFVAALSILVGSVFLKTSASRNHTYPLLKLYLPVRRSPSSYNQKFRYLVVNSRCAGAHSCCRLGLGSRIR